MIPSTPVSHTRTYHRYSFLDGLDDDDQREVMALKLLEWGTEFDMRKKEQRERENKWMSAHKASQIVNK